MFDQGPFHLFLRHLIYCIVPLVLICLIFKSLPLLSIKLHISWIPNSIYPLRVAVEVNCSLTEDFSHFLWFPWRFICSRSWMSTVSLQTIVVVFFLFFFWKCSTSSIIWQKTAKQCQAVPVNLNPYSPRAKNGNPPPPLGNFRDLYSLKGWSVRRNNLLVGHSVTST